LTAVMSYALIFFENEKATLRAPDRKNVFISAIATGHF